MFNTLSKADQADLLEAESVYLSSRRESEYLVDLYQLNDFYVEVHYHLASDAVIVQSFYPRHQQQPPIYQLHLPRMVVRKGA
jgi:hypothetical protein